MTELARGELCLQQRPNNRVGAERLEEEEVTAMSLLSRIQLFRSWPFSIDRLPHFTTRRSLVVHGFQLSATFSFACLVRNDKLLFAV